MSTKLGYIKRVLDIKELLEESSLFLFGPRMTGKTKYIENNLQKKAILSLNASFSFTKVRRFPIIPIAQVQ